MIDKSWVVYLVRCSDHSLYCGITNDLNKRLAAHNSGKGGKYTRSRRPVELVAVSPDMSRGDALKLEYKVKNVGAHKKISVLNERVNAASEKEMILLQIKKNLQLLSNSLQHLSKSLRIIIK
jgi:putative endonuclease